MSKLTEVMVYITKNYPLKSELSNARLTKIIYLADWIFALKHKKQITEIQWRFNNHGPFVWDIHDNAIENPEIFKVVDIKNVYGNKKTLIKLSDENYPISLLNEEKSALDFVMESTKPLNWDRFIQLVYSTFPILVSTKGSDLNLIELAKIKESLKSRKVVAAT